MSLPAVSKISGILISCLISRNSLEQLFLTTAAYFIHHLTLLNWFVEIHLPRMEMTIFWDHWPENMSPTFKSSTAARSKWWFCKMSAVHFQIVSKSVPGTSLLLPWHSWFLQFIRSFTSDWDIIPNMTLITLVSKVRSKSQWPVNPMDGQKI